MSSAWKAASRKELADLAARLGWPDGDVRAVHPENGWTLLHWAAANADCLADPYAIFEALLNAGVDVNAQDHDGGTFLLTILPWAGPDTVRHYLGRGADPNLADHSGTTPLMRTFGADGYEADLDTAEVLLKAGADPRARCPGGESALDIARQFVEVCEDDSFLRLFERYEAGKPKRRKR
jgi:ankyrin repeat protein